MKTATIFATLLAVSAAKKCIVKPNKDSAELSSPENSESEINGNEPGSNGDEPGSNGIEPGSNGNEPGVEPGVEPGNVELKKLPSNFIWGAATAAYQVEGAWNEGGRAESVWDHFTHLYPKNVESSDRSKDFTTNGNVACDSYHKFQDDIEMLKIMHAKYYRFSISWSRLFPDGQAKKEGDQWNNNEEGTNYYNELINALLSNDIIPFVTLYHWDLPYALHEKYGGWLDYHSQYDFASYAEYCFETFGDRVKNWITINEPWVNCVSGYRLGPGKAPYRCTGEAPRKLANNTDNLDLEGGCSYEIGPSQYSPESEVLEADRPPQRLEDVWCSHNILLAHAQAVKVYREKFQQEQQGLIGITVDGEAQIPWTEPGMTDEQLKKNEEYANLAAEFRIGWYSDPPLTGDYPQSVKERMGKDLPEFTPEQKELLKGSSSDFLGWNSYTSHWAAPIDGVAPPTPEEANFENSKKDMWDDNCRGRGEGWTCIPPTLGSQAGSSWNTKYPPTIRVGLNWLSNRYAGLINNGIVITENGCSQPNKKVNRPNDTVTLEYFKSIGQEQYADVYGEDIIEDEADINANIIKDNYRIDWYAKYLNSLLEAYSIDNIDIRGYFAWSLIDNFEWENGYETRFGMTYIDFYNDPELKRTPKDSLTFLRQWYEHNVEQEETTELPTDVEEPEDPEEPEDQENPEDEE